MRFGVVIFPGSNCEQDVIHACRYLGFEAEYVWHGDTDLSGFDAVVLPGGFSYGDYIRCGAVARFSPVMAEVIRFAERVAPVIGICNGFQILTEAHLLPGALLRNVGLKFICKDVHLRVEESVCRWLDLARWRADRRTRRKLACVLNRAEHGLQDRQRTRRRCFGGDGLDLHVHQRHRRPHDRRDLRYYAAPH